MKNEMIPSGTEPAAFRVVAQCPNQFRHRVSPTFDVEYIKRAVYLEKSLLVFSLHAETRYWQ